MKNEIKTWQERFSEWRSPEFRDEPVDDSDAYVAVPHLLSEIAELRARIESLAADAERMDHLFSKLPLNMFCAALGINPPDTGWKINSVDDWARQQLDSAIAKEKA